MGNASPHTEKKPMNAAFRLSLGCLVFGMTGACLVLAGEDDPEKKVLEKKARASAFPEALFKRLDTNQDGKISPDEFKKLSELREQLTQKGGSPQARAKLIEKLKEKGIDPESIKQKLQEKGIDPETIKEKLKEKKAASGELKPADLFKKLDKNQDNYLDPDEFRALRSAVAASDAASKK